jgi:hypothetical protein
MGIAKDGEFTWNDDGWNAVQFTLSLAGAGLNFIPGGSLLRTSICFGVSGLSLDISIAQGACD